jgi:hypothetical protein
MLIVRDYNNIKMIISPDEARLFYEHLKSLNSIIGPGMSKHNWGS